MANRFFLYLIIGLLGGLIGAGAVLYLHAEDSGSNMAGLPVGDFALLDHTGRFHRLYDYASRKAVVLYTDGVGCSVIRHTIATIKQLRDQFREDNIEFFLINTDSESDRSVVAQYAADLGIDIPILMDDSQLVAESLGTLRAGEALLLDTRSWSIRYRGPIDDRTDYESQNPQSGQHYLRDGIQALLNGEQLAVTERPTVGCLIDFKKRRGKQAPMISYADEVVPILQEKCVVCHRSGAIGPWTMNSHAVLQAWAPRVREAVMSKRMPPWHADPAIGQFVADRSLTADERRTLIRWIDAGAPGGKEHDPLTRQPPKPAEEWMLGEPDLIIQAPTQKIPAKGLLAWQHTRVPVPIKEDTWIRAVQMKPSNPAVTHHVFAFVQYPERYKSRQPKWADGANAFFAAYVPGINVLPFPEDAGQFLPAGSILIFQSHYITVGYPTEDNVKLGLYFHEKPPGREYKMTAAVNLDIKVPPHAKAHREAARTKLTEAGELHAFYPHMHYRGSRFQYTAKYPDGTEEVLLSVPKYDFNWQSFYQLEKPKAMPVGTEILVEAEFDNSKQNPVNPDPSAEVGWGLRSVDEMLVGYIMYTTSRSDVIGN